MPQRFNIKRLVIASHNPGKVLEISALLSLCNIEVISAASLWLAEPAEDWTTFIENANIKAAAAADAGPGHAGGCLLYTSPSPRD